MNITLRKANALQNSINDLIKSIKVSLTVELNEFQEVPVELEKANKAMVAADQRRQTLLLALYNIRGLVAQGNSSSGIDLALTKAAFIDRRITQLEELANAGEIMNMAVLLGKIEKIKNLKDEARSRIYGYGDTVSTSVLNKEQIDQAKAEVLNLRKQKQKLNDEVLELNIKTEIPLTEDVVALLQKEGLL